ncbi:MAG TPA: preprotein translocase subunit YajC [Gemmataceae bacterium]|nr:preprotein translocase subunit YajC [Gemmataceae bacterium]
MFSWLVLFAETEQPQAPGWAFYLPFIVMGLMLVMYLRTTSRQRTELQKALAAMKKGDKVVTSGGILGVIVAVKENEDEVTLKVDETSNTRIRVLKSSVVKIVSGDQTAGEAKS